MLAFIAQQPGCTVAMEACASAHYWAREIGRLGHTARLVPPSYVKPFMKRQKNDMADAEAICEAAQRPTMRFAAVKSEDQQASAVVFRARDLLVRQRTQIINSLRGHLAEYGLIVAKGPSQLMAVVPTESGSVVTEVAFRDVSIPERGIMHKLRGEALYLDLWNGWTLSAGYARASQAQLAARRVRVIGAAPWGRGKFRPKNA